MHLRCAKAKTSWDSRCTEIPCRLERDYIHESTANPKELRIFNVRKNYTTEQRPRIRVYLTHPSVMAFGEFSVGHPEILVTAFFQCLRILAWRTAKYFHRTIYTRQSCLFISGMATPFTPVPHFFRRSKHCQAQCTFCWATSVGRAWIPSILNQAAQDGYKTLGILCYPITYLKRL